MKAVIQRVKKASVEIDGRLYSKIDRGILVLIGIENGDDADKAKFLADKIAELRIFDDNAGKMNLSVSDIQGEILVVSQFTLAADCKKGKRPGFDNAAKPETAVPLYEMVVEHIKNREIPVQTGKFGVMMDVCLINEGPVTFILSK